VLEISSLHVHVLVSVGAKGLSDHDYAGVGGDQVGEGVCVCSAVLVEEHGGAVVTAC
jgi:hypothetical protein